MKKNTPPIRESINVRGGAELVGKLRAIAAMEGVSRGGLIRSVLEEFVKAYQSEHGELKPFGATKQSRNRP